MDLLKRKRDKKRAARSLHSKRTKAMKARHENMFGVGSFVSENEIKLNSVAPSWPRKK